MQAYVYKSQRKDDTYVFLAARDDFTRLPEPLRTQLGGLQFVLEVALAPGRQRDLEHELQPAQLRAQRLGQAGEIVARGEEDVGIVLALALVDVGLHGRLAGAAILHDVVCHTAYPQPTDARTRRLRPVAAAPALSRHVAARVPDHDAVQLAGAQDGAVSGSRCRPRPCP